jgi:riboflavin kinase/FMN adenylyltransferase
MQRWRGLDAVPNGWGRCVVTIGTFDGVHSGHRALIAEAVDAARELGIPSVVLTFDPHPSEVLRPGTQPPILTVGPRKAELIAACGIDVLFVMPFTAKLAEYSPAEFVHEALISRLHAGAVYVGQNFRFGHKAAGGFAKLAEFGNALGFSAHEVPLLSDGPTVISATYIRSCVDAGEVEDAAHALGRPHRLDGLVVRGDQRGRELGFPTANLRADRNAAVPADGVYAGRVVRLDRFGSTLDLPPLGIAAISVGTNPTFEGRQRRVESFVLDYSGDLYGASIGVEFVHRLRGMERYDTIEALVDQMNKDVQQTRDLMS